MDQTVMNLLKGWELDEVIDTFVENKIDLKTFHCLTEEDIKELITPLGTRKKFVEKYNYYMIDKAVIEHCPLSEPDGDTLSDLSINSGATTSTITSLISYDNLKPHNYPLKATFGAPLVVKSVEETVGNSVRNLLDSCEDGKIILASYGPFKKFRRNHLCNFIIKNELEKDLDKRISTERFKILAQEINDIFIHEEASIYYIPYTRGENKEIVAASGKLFSAYIHQRKILRQAGILKSRYSTAVVDEVEESPALIEEEIEESLTWLYHNSIPFELVSDHWAKTVKARVNSKETIDEYFRKYPALTNQSGFLLLENDFKFLHENKENALLYHWPILAPHIYNLLVEKNDSLTKEFLLQEQKNFSVVDNDAKELIALKLLPLLLQQPLIKSKERSHWKPTKKELLDGFILSVDDASNLNKKLEERQLKCESLKLTKQPIPIIIGSSPPYESFVSINNILYKIDSPIRAVDICFKTFFALNANYPAEAVPSWMYLQKGIFKINTNTDQKYRSVDVLISSIKCRIENYHFH